MWVGGRLGQSVPRPWAWAKLSRWWKHDYFGFGVDITGEALGDAKR